MDAKRNKCRVQVFREETGAAGLSGRDMPTDQTLAAHASVCARAQEYKESGVFPDDTRMDQFRVAAYLDLLNGIPADTRIAAGQLTTVSRNTGEPDSADDFPSETGPEDDDPDGCGPDDGGPTGKGPDGRHDPSDRSSAPPRLTDLVLPLATLLGLAERPGEGHGLGPLDPALCRELAATAAGSSWTRLCVTVTASDGMPVGHGCARPHRKRGTAKSTRSDPPPTFPARVNLTINAARLAELAVTTGPPGSAPWVFLPDDSPGPPGGFGIWILTLPDGRQLTVNLEPVPVLQCDHRHESHAYQPNDMLRHLVQIRDYECTFPTCSRHARESDFEHAVPYDKGGRTCACNAGARSRACHQVKQSNDWQVTQPRPGWHQWQAPSGHSYTQGPKHYPA